VPQLVVYRTSGLTYFIAKNLLRIRHISLVNILMKKEVVRELIQDDYNSAGIKSVLKMLLEDTKIRNSQLDDYQLLKDQLGKFSASENAARIIVSNA
jgi:lipid-A-disaccharide synthase